MSRASITSATKIVAPIAYAVPAEYLNKFFVPGVACGVGTPLGLKPSEASGWHGVQSPPQSISASFWFFMPSVHDVPLVIVHLCAVAGTSEIVWQFVASCHCCGTFTKLHDLVCHPFPSQLDHAPHCHS